MTTARKPGPAAESRDHRSRACAGRCSSTVVATLTADQTELFFITVARRGAAQPAPIDELTGPTLASRAAAIFEAREVQRRAAA